MLPRIRRHLDWEHSEASAIDKKAVLVPAFGKSTA